MMNLFTRLATNLPLPGIVIAATCLQGHVAAEMLTDVLAHRKSPLSIRVQDKNGAAIPGAKLDVKMERHAFKFGTNVRDRLFSITEAEYNNLNPTQKLNLLPNLTSFGKPQITATWQDVLKHRQHVYEQFNNVVPTTGMQWMQQQNQGYSVIDAAINQAQNGGLTVSGASVVWQQDAFPTPLQYRSAANPNPQAFHNALVTERLSSSGVLGRFSDAGAGPTVTDWKLLNEPLHQTYYSDVFVEAGIYTDHIQAMADYFIRADAARPDAILSINDYNIFNWNDDSKATTYRDVIGLMRAAGAPIDRIGIQAHMARNNVTKADMMRRLDILAQTGLPIEITEFDTRDDPLSPFAPLTPAEQERIFSDVLTVSFEHPSVVGFTMWGIWDPAHFRGNAALYDQNWNVKDEASPWFDLVRGEWMPNLLGLEVDSNGSWIAPGGLFSGQYEITANFDGQSVVVDDFNLTSSSALVISMPVAVPEPTSLAYVAVAGIVLLRRNRRR